jgi:hypothetical protein
MNVNKKSLSYDLYTFWDRNTDKRTSNICQYTRGVLAGIFLSLVTIFLGVIFSVILLDPIVSLLAYWVTGISFISFFGGTEISFLVVGFAAYLVSSIAFATFIIYNGYDKLKDKVEHTSNPNVLKTVNTLGVFGEYIKSKHDKICRNISFTSGN